MYRSCPSEFHWIIVRVTLSRYLRVAGHPRECCKADYVAAQFAADSLGVFAVQNEKSKLAGPSHQQSQRRSGWTYPHYQRALASEGGGSVGCNEESMPRLQYAKNRHVFWKTPAWGRVKVAGEGTVLRSRLYLPTWRDMCMMSIYRGLKGLLTNLTLASSCISLGFA